MKNAITALVVLIIIGIVGYLVMNKDEVAQVNTDTNTPSESENVDTTEDREVKGTVTKVDASTVPVDGPTYITVKPENGPEVVVAVPSMGRNLCAAQANLILTETLKVGDRVEIKGGAGARGMIIPCDDASHFIKLED